MNFTTPQAKSLVIGCVAGAGLLASAAQLANGDPPDVRVAVGAAIAAGLLYGLADIAPPLAGGLALLVLTGAALTNGVAVANVVSSSTRKG